MREEALILQHFRYCFTGLQIAKHETLTEPDFIPSKADARSVAGLQCLAGNLRCVIPTRDSEIHPTHRDESVQSQARHITDEQVAVAEQLRDLGNPALGDRMRRILDHGPAGDERSDTR